MRSVLLDTNLLVLLVVGLYDKSAIGEHKRTREFVPEDYEILSKKLNEFEEVWITSHCLAEVSNLLKQTHAGQGRDLLNILGEFGGSARESHSPMKRIFDHDFFRSFGVADTGLFIKAHRVTCVLTTDFVLYRKILMEGRKVINFNHLRQESIFA